MEELREATIQLNIPVSSLTLTPGEYVTVFLHERDRVVQVELHVTTGGEARVVLDAENRGVVKTFAEVYGQ